MQQLKTCVNVTDFLPKTHRRISKQELVKMNIVPVSAKVANNRFDQTYFRMQLVTVVSNSG